MLSYQYPEKTFEPIIRFQATHYDISMLVPYSVTVADLEHALAQVDVRVINVILRDIFEKQEWCDKRSITIRVILQDAYKTMTREEIDDLARACTQAVRNLGAVIR